MPKELPINKQLYADLEVAAKKQGLSPGQYATELILESIRKPILTNEECKKLREPDSKMEEYMGKPLVQVFEEKEGFICGYRPFSVGIRPDVYRLLKKALGYLGFSLDRWLAEQLSKTLRDLPLLFYENDC